MAPATGLPQGMSGRPDLEPARRTANAVGKADSQCVRDGSKIVTPLDVLGIGSQWLLTIRAQPVCHRYTIGYSLVSFSGQINSPLSNEAFPVERVQWRNDDRQRP